MWQVSMFYKCHEAGDSSDGCSQDHSHVVMQHDYTQHDDIEHTLSGHLLRRRRADVDIS
jgi:hypothetical protein